MATGKKARPLFIFYNFSCKYDLGKWSAKYITKTAVSWVTPAGYTYFSFIYVATGSGTVWHSRINPRADTVCRLYNFSDGVTNKTFRIKVCFIATDLTIALPES